MEKFQVSVPHHSRTVDAPNESTVGLKWVWVSVGRGISEKENGCDIYKGTKGLVVGNWDSQGGGWREV